MTSFISNTEKKQFIRSFLKGHQLKRREGVWILNYLMTSEELLSRVHFHQSVAYCPLAIILSTVETDDIPFRFYIGSEMTTDAERAFQILKQSGHQPIHIQLNFSTMESGIIYDSVVEINPYVPSQIKIREKDENIANSFIQESQLLFQEKFILHLIDQALDEGDEESFHHYVAQLKKMKQR